MDNLPLGGQIYGQIRFLRPNGREILNHSSIFTFLIELSCQYPLFVVIPKDDVTSKFSFSGIFTGNFPDLKISRDST